MNQAGFESLRSDILAIHAELAETHLTSSQRRQLNASRKDLADAVCDIVVCGEFSRGKSSLLNALVERPGLFPIDLDVTTSIVTELRWGPEETATVYLGGSSGATQREIHVEQVADFVTERGNPGNSKGVVLVRLTAPIEQLRQGLVLVDTPGIGSLNIEHATATYAFLSKADAVIFVGAADERMSTSELSYLKDAMDKCGVVITVLTKIDKLFDPGPEVELAVARERIVKVTGRPVDDVMVVGVSARRKREGLVAGDPELIHLSGFPVLQELLWARLATTWGAARLNHACGVLDDVVTAMAAPFVNERTALTRASALEEVHRELESAQAEASRLALGSAGWRDELATAFQSAASPIKEQLGDNCEELLRTFLARTDSDEAVTDPHTLVRETAASLVDIVDRSYQSLDEAAERAVEAASGRTRLRISATAFPAPAFQVSVEVPDVVLTPRPTDGRLKLAFAKAAAGSGTGAALGAAIGGLIVPGIGTSAGVVGGLIGNAIGLFTGLREHAEKARREQRGKRAELLESLVLPVLERKAERARRTFEETVAATEGLLLEQFDEGITAAQESLSESVLALEDLRSATEHERVRRRAELETRLTWVAGLRGRVNAIEARISARG